MTLNAQSTLILNQKRGSLMRDEDLESKKEESAPSIDVHGGPTLINQSNLSTLSSPSVFKVS